MFTECRKHSVKSTCQRGYPFETPAGAIYLAVAKGIFTRGGICQKTLKKTGLSHSVYQKANLLLLKKKLAASEMKKSEFFREIFLNANVNLTVKGAPSKELKDLVYIFSKSSNNLNQIAYKLNLAHQMGRVSESLYINILNRLVNIEELMLAGVNNAD